MRIRGREGCELFSPGEPGAECENTLASFLPADTRSPCRTFEKPEASDRNKAGILSQRCRKAERPGQADACWSPQDRNWRRGGTEDIKEAFFLTRKEVSPPAEGGR